MQISVRNTRVFYVTQFLYALVFTIPIWIVYYQGRISVSQISFLVAFQYAVQLLLELPTGAFADLLGRKTSVASGYLFWAMFYAFVIKTTGFYPLVFATFLGGVAESLISGSLEALVYDSLKQDNRESSFAKVSARNGVLFQIALAIATFSGGFLFQFAWWLPYLACFGANTCAFLVSLSFIEPNIDTVKFTLHNYVKQIKEGSIHAFATKKVALMSLFYVFVSAITWTNNLYFFDFMLVELKFSSAERSVFGAFIRIFNVVVLSTLLSKENVFTRKRSIYFFPIVMIVCFLPGLFFHGYAALPFIAGAVMAGTGRWIVLTKYTNELFESKYRATAISALSMLVGILFVFITLISGPVIEYFGGVKVMYTLLGVLTVVTVLPLSIILNRRDNFS